MQPGRILCLRPTKNTRVCWVFVACKNVPCRLVYQVIPFFEDDLYVILRCCVVWMTSGDPPAREYRIAGMLFLRLPGVFPEMDYCEHGQTTS